MVHRGPDDKGFFVADGLGLGMRRLSSTDVAGGHQPIASEDGLVQVVFNGEIYNYPELRTKPSTRGHIFRTRSDTEVSAHAYEEKGWMFDRSTRDVWDRSRLSIASDARFFGSANTMFC